VPSPAPCGQLTPCFSAVAELLVLPVVAAISVDCHLVHFTIVKVYHHIKLAVV